MVVNTADRFVEKPNSRLPKPSWIFRFKRSVWFQRMSDWGDTNRLSLAFSHKPGSVRDQAIN